MLIPRFTIRSLLLLTVVAGLVAWVLHQAQQGVVWAACCGWAFLFTAVLFGVYAAAFTAAWSLSEPFRRRDEHAESPFAKTSSDAPVRQETNPV